MGPARIFINNISEEEKGLISGKRSFKGIGPKMDIGPLPNILGCVIRDGKSQWGQYDSEEADRSMGKNLINFDDHCRKLKNSKKVRKKMREVIDLGAKVDNFVYPVDSCFLHTKDPSKPHSGSYSYALNKSNPVELPLSCDSLTHSDVRNCTTRITNGGMGKMVVEMRSSINRLGITNVSDSYDLISRIRELERRDHKEERDAKGTEYNYP